MSYLHAIILAIIEGLTEFLPVSSTGHMIIGSSLMGIAEDDFTKLFTIVIQLGAILSVVVIYFKRFFQSVNFYLKLFVAFLPAAVFGVLLSDRIDALLESPTTVAISLVLGGIILLFVDKWFKNPTVTEEKNISFMTALKIGFFQCIAMIPGVSRSAATIVGGMSQKLTRSAAAEFSFFLAVPTMLGATAKKTLDFLKEGNSFTSEQVNLLIVGNIVAFIVAFIAIKGFINFVSKNGFKVFGIYRIVVGLAILGLIWAGFDLKIV
ncbi:MAG TPA: undecaprenyl-diphosphate phosphatase [Crocinitomicaceae bacterium]|nr:undecaprenyl-diphosphate phosphatase [Crocinitomicaceae bacterium]